MANTSTLPTAPAEIGGAVGVVQSTTSTTELESEVVRVKGKGTGQTEESALKDAYRDAVESAVGLYVDSEQMMKNEELIKDQILTQSNAYIVNYEVKDKKVSDGLVTITIWAQVRKRALTKRIAGVMPSQTFSVGNMFRGLHAQITTVEARNADGASLLAKELKDFSPRYMAADCSLALNEPVVDDGSTDELGYRRRKHALRSTSGVAVAYLFKSGINAQRYFDCVAQRLVPILRQVSVAEYRAIKISAQRTGNVDMTAVRKMLRWDAMNLNTGLGAGSVNIKMSSPDLDPRWARIGKVAPPPPYNLLVVTGVNSMGTIYSAEAYQLDKETLNVFENWARQENRLNDPMFSVTLMDDNGEAVMLCDVQPKHINCISGAFSKYGRGDGSFVLSPWMDLRSIEEYFWKKIDIPAEVLPKVKQIKIAVNE